MNTISDFEELAARYQRAACYSSEIAQEAARKGRIDAAPFFQEEARYFSTMAQAFLCDALKIAWYG